MATVKVTIAEQAKYMRRLSKEYMPAVRRGIVSGVMRCVGVMHRRTREAPPANPRGVGHGGAVDTHDYLQRWKATATAEGGRIYNNSPYAAVIEFGRRPHKWVSREGMLNLEVWAQHRLGVAKKDAKGVAFLVARAIWNRGLLARRVMTDGVEEMTRIVETEMKRELDAALAKAS